MVRGILRADLVHFMSPATIPETPAVLKLLLREKPTVSGLPFSAAPHVHADRSLRTPNLVIAVGTNVDRKRFDLLAEACEQLEGVQLLIAGNGTEHLSSLSGKVQGLGRVSEETLNDLYARASLFALPSLYEGFGLPVLEAWTRGCPLIITESVASRLPEGISRDSTVVPTNLTREGLANAIREALRNPPAQAGGRRLGTPELLAALSALVTPKANGDAQDATS